MIKIGYQGISGSYSEKVAKIFQNKLNTESEIFGLVASQNVVESLKNKDIDYGVVAYENNTAGIVEETKVALRNVEYKIIDKIALPIRHCVFKKKDVSINGIKNVASHIQAIKQTEQTIFDNFKKLNIIETKDTALSAKMLSKDLLPEDTIVICNKDVGIRYNLDIVLEDICDNKNNQTTFYVINLEK